MTPNISNQDVYEQVKYAIQNKLPYSISRIGDGEIQILNNVVTAELKTKICKLWNCGETEFEKYRILFCDIINYSIANSTVIGILDKNNEICKHMQYSEHKWSLPLDYVKNIREINNLRVCDHQITRSKLFGDINNLKTLIAGTPINIVSPNTDNLIKNNISELLQTDVKYTTIKNDRDDLLQKIYAIDEPIVIYGASLTGKDIGARLATECGKICMDYGATIDAWSGLASRPWFKSGSLQNYCLIK